jgi:putative ATPase
MVEGGEDPAFIARRLLILAAEDIGLANPTALALAEATFSAVEKVGWPESRIIPAQCTIYLATSDKSNSAYAAIEAAMAEVRRSGNLSVPLHLRNAPTRLMKDLGYGEEYRYSHAFEGNFVHQEYLPAELSGKEFYVPGKNGREQAIGEWLRKKWGSLLR